MEVKEENKSLLNQLDTLEKNNGGRREEILRALEGKFDIARADNNKLAEALENVKRSFSSLEVALDKAEDGVMKGTAKQIKRGRN
ncbi:hypothetical protein WN943_011087 [Citrus x changshan-huyou]